MESNGARYNVSQSAMPARFSVSQAGNTQQYGYQIKGTQAHRKGISPSNFGSAIETYPGALILPDGFQSHSGEGRLSEFTDALQKHLGQGDTSPSGTPNPAANTGAAAESEIGGAAEALPEIGALL